MSMDWDSSLDEAEAKTAASDFELLPDGEYEIEIKKLEKDSYTAGPGSKISSCPLAIVHVIAKSSDGKRNYFRERLYIHEDNKWRLFQFFVCLGLRKHGDGKSNMPWAQVEGATGRAKLGHRVSKTNGESYQTVVRWLEPAVAPDEW